jgi:hypothetical protein
MKNTAMKQDRDAEADAAGRVADELIAKSLSESKIAYRRWSEDLSNALYIRSDGWNATAFHTSVFYGHATGNTSKRWTVQLMPETIEGDFG